MPTNKTTVKIKSSGLLCLYNDVALKLDTVLTTLPYNTVRTHTFPYKISFIWCTKMHETRDKQ